MDGKIKFGRFFDGRTALDGDYFKEMEGITLAELQALPQHELNKISIAWLYDYAEVNGLLYNREIVLWIEKQRTARKRIRVLQLPKKGVSVEYVGRDKRVYRAKGIRYEYKDGIMYRDGREDKAYLPSPEQSARLNDLLRAFLADYEDAKAEREGYKKIAVNGSKLFVRMAGCRTYRFIVERDNGYVFPKTCTIHDFLYGTFMWGTDRRSWLEINPNVVQAVKDGTFPLLHIGDEYMEKEIKYLCDCATEDEIRWLNATDGKVRFIKTKDVYNASDLEITKYLARHHRWTYKIRGIYIEGVIDGAKIGASWETDDDVLTFNDGEKGHMINIAPDLKQVLYNLLDAERERIEKLKSRKD